MTNEAFEKQKGKGITSTEQARKLGSMGGKASQEAYKKKKVFTEIIKTILEQSATEKMTAQIQKAFGVMDRVPTIKEAMVYAQTIKAISNQDTKAFKAIVDRVDGKAIQTIENKEDSSQRQFSSVKIINGKKIIELK